MKRKKTERIKKLCGLRKTGARPRRRKAENGTVVMKEVKAPQGHQPSLGFKKEVRTVSKTFHNTRMQQTNIFGTRISLQIWKKNKDEK